MKKTNLDIIDQDSWNWVKNKKNQYELRSVANFIFKMIDVYRILDIEKILFLLQIEKYFEYNYFDMEELSKAMELKTDKVIKLVDKYLGPRVPLFDLKDENLKIKVIKKIHELMIENRILPRELSIAYNLRHFIDKNQLDMSRYNNFEEKDLGNIGVDNKLILSILFPDAEELRKAIYCEAINFADWFINFEKDLDLECSKCDKDYFLKKPDYIYYKSGIDVSFDDLKDDLLSEILKQHFKEKNIVYYGFCLIIAIDSLIQKNLLMVKNYIEEELYLYKKTEEVLMFINILTRISKNECISFFNEKEYFEEIYKKISEYGQYKEIFIEESTK